MPREEFIAAIRTRNFPIEVVNEILYQSVTRYRDSICKNEYVSHAAGSAVAALVVRIIIDKIVFLISKFESCADDLFEEYEFSVKKLQEHIMFITGIRRNIKQLIDDPAKELESMDADVNNERRRENSVNKAFRTLTGAAAILDKDLPDVLRKVKKQLGELNKELLIISDKIEQLSKPERLTAKSDRKMYKETIQRVIRSTARSMRSMKRQLSDILTKVIEIEKQVAEDWTNDVCDIVLEDEDCRPSLTGSSSSEL